MVAYLFTVFMLFAIHLAILISIFLCLCRDGQEEFSLLSKVHMKEALLLHSYLRIGRGGLSSGEGGGEELSWAERGRCSN